MNEKNKLSLGMALLFLIAFVSFGLIIVNEKSYIFLNGKAEKKLSDYINNKYNDIIDEVTLSKSHYNQKNKKYTIKVMNKKNNNLYFLVSYKNKKITSTYLNDYEKGKTLFSYINKKMQSKLKVQLNKNKQTIYKDIIISIPNDLNTYNSTVKDYLLASNNLEQLNIYNLETVIYIENITYQNMVNNIISFYQYSLTLGIKIKSYNIEFIDKSDITNSINIDMLTDEDILNNLSGIVTNALKNL